MNTKKEDNLNVVIADNGTGMSGEVLQKAGNPFYSDGSKHPNRKVGLGLPFLFQISEQTGGKVAVESEEGIGTTVRFSLDLGHLDLPMFGNFTAAAVSLITYGFDGNLTIERIVNNAEKNIRLAREKAVHIDHWVRFDMLVSSLFS